MRITKMIPRYYVENFGTISIDEQCSWIEDEGHYAVCFVLDIPYAIKVEDTATWFFDEIPRIEKELRLMPGALNYALTIYLIDHNIEFKHID